MHVTSIIICHLKRDENFIVTKIIDVYIDFYRAYGQSHAFNLKEGSEINSCSIFYH